MVIAALKQVIEVQLSELLKIDSMLAVNPLVPCGVFIKISSWFCWPHFDLCVHVVVVCCT